MRDELNMEFRKCDYSDADYILKLKELCIKWYIEIIYGWNIEVQREKTIHELQKHKDDMRILIKDGKDIGVTTFYEENNQYVVGLIMIHPEYQGESLGSKIIKEYIDLAKKSNKKIKIKVYKENPAKRLYERLGFKIYNEDDTHLYLSIDFDE